MPIIIERRDTTQAQNPNLPMTGGVQPVTQQTQPVQNPQPVTTTGGMMPIQPRTYGGGNQLGGGGDDWMSGYQQPKFNDKFHNPFPINPALQQPVQQPNPQQAAMLGAVAPQFAQPNLEQNSGIMTQAKVAPQINPLPVQTQNPYQQTAPVWTNMVYSSESVYQPTSVVT